MIESPREADYRSCSHRRSKYSAFMPSQARGAFLEKVTAVLWAVIPPSGAVSNRHGVTLGGRAGDRAPTRTGCRRSSPARITTRHRCSRRPNLLREARRQKGVAEIPVPEICVLDPDGDILRALRRVRSRRAVSGLGLLSHRALRIRPRRRAVWDNRLRRRRLVCGVARGRAVRLAAAAFWSA